MKTHKIIDEVNYMLTDETKNDKNLNAIDKDVLALLQFFGNGKILQHNKGGWFPLSLKKNPKLKSLSLEEMLVECGVKANYTTIYRAISKLVALGYIEYKTGYWNYDTFKGQLPYFLILKGTVCHLIDNTVCNNVATNGISERNNDIAIAIYKDGEQDNTQGNRNTNVTHRNTMDNKDIATAIYKDIEGQNRNNFSSTCNTERYSDIAIAKEKEEEQEKEIYKVTYLLRDSHQSDPDPVNNITSDLGIYVDDNTPDVPEWMDELPVTEPFVQYTDDIQGEAMQQTTNNTFQADERENDPDPVTGKVNKITSSDEGIDGENALNGLKVALGVSPTDIYDEETEDDLSQADENDPDEPQENETSLNAALSDERGDGGTTTHRQAESLSNGEKTTSTSATDPVNDKDNNNFITDTQNMTVTERKEKQTELSRKWENFKTQVPQMHRADAEMYFSRFLSKVEQYYTGTHIAITQERFTREFNALKPLADWSEDDAKQDVEMWISQGFNPDTLKRYVRQKYGEAHDEFVMAQWKQHHSKPIELNPEYVKNPNAPYVLPF